MTDYRYTLFNGRRNVIWGAGHEGVKILAETIRQGIYIDCFCDTDASKQRIRIWNKKVISPEAILDNPTQWNVIIGTNIERNVRQIVETLSKNGVGDYIRGVDIQSMVPEFAIEYRTIWKLSRDAKEKKIILYGCNNLTRKVIHISKMLDISIAYIVSESDSGSFCGIEVKDIYDLVYEDIDKIMVIVTDDEERSSKRNKLVEIGLTEKINFDFWKYYSVGNYKTYILDPNLGHTYIDNSFNKASGITLFGDINARTKVALLGGSTTDATRFVWKSWGEFLYEKLSEEGMECCILCAGCSGYNSSQELVKLERDIIPLAPDMVISYSGFNDSRHYYGRDELELYPFVGHYQYDMTLLEAKLIRYERIDESPDSYAFGAKGMETRYERFTRNIRMMNAICKTENIKFKSFLQPYLGTIKELTCDELELIISEQLSERIAQEGKFYEEAARNLSDSYIDITDIFEGKEGIYIDDCHVTEKGNKIISDTVFKYIKDELKCAY